MIRKTNSAGPATSSPRSSDEAASRNGSPATKLTAFSPENARMRSFVENTSGNDAGSVLAKDGPPHRVTTQGMANIADPFTGPSAHGAGMGMYLSPTASCFTPTGMMYHGAFGATNRSTSFMREPPHPGMGYLAATSEPDTPATANTCAGKPNDFGPIGDTTMSSDPLPMMYCQFGQFDDENRNRAFAIEGAPHDFPYVAIANLFDRREFSTLRGPVLSELVARGMIYVGFTDVRDARNAFEKVHKAHPEWRLHPMTAKEFAVKFGLRELDSVSDFEGHVAASVYYDGRTPDLDGRMISYSFKDMLETFGDIKAFKTVPIARDNVIDFLVEFFDTRSAENAVSTLCGSTVNDCFLEVSLYKPDVVERPDYVDAFGADTMGRSPVSGRTSGFVHDSPLVQLSPTGRSMIPIDDPAAAMDWTSGSRNGCLYRPPRPDFSRYERSSNGQNHVDIERIRMGLDVRTTIMLRNIPNKIDQAMLKEIVDETSFGKYDFMYLRIDFANNCNVGYAFINFEDPLDIIDFAKARAGRPWNCFNSDKIAEISYATIQGKDCLVQKFRNSSVMLEHPSFRPKLFYTGTGPLAGTEERFPGPDNPSKMRRSVENAEHVGLFAPRVGQQYRDEQRRRRSQFDRGTMAAQREATWVRSGGPRRSPTRFFGTSDSMGSPTHSWYRSPFGGNNRCA
ncbi:hypothetical protein VTO42DRAFT_678 [Malbranchea cinnamomea]